MSVKIILPVFFFIVLYLLMVVAGDIGRPRL